MVIAMRIQARLGWAGRALFALALAGCDGAPVVEDAGPTEDAGPSGPRATLSWVMRCNEGRCPPEEPPVRTIDAHDGEDGHVIGCDLTETGTGTRRFDLTARLGERYGIEVRGASTGLMGGRLEGSLCRLTVLEEADVRLLAACGSSAPTADRPCQFQRIDIRDEAGVPTLFAELRCVAAPEERDPSDLRDITSPTAALGYAELVFTGCDGL